MRGKPFVYDDFSGGINSIASPYALDNNQFRDAMNVNSDIIGTLQKRKGTTELVQTTDPPKSLFPFHGGTDYLIVIEDTGAAQTATSITTGGSETDIKGGMTMTTGTTWRAIQAPENNTGSNQGPFWMMNGTDTPLQWTGSGNLATWTVDGAGTLPNGKYVIYFDNRVFVAGVSGEESRLYASELGDPRGWDTTADASYTTTFDPDDGEEITGLGTIGPYLLVFKPRKTYVVTDTDTGGYRAISNEVGCVAPDSIVETDIGTFFLSNEQGVMRTNGSSIVPISIQVQDIFDSIGPTGINLASAVYKDYRYYISIATDEAPENDVIMEYDTRLESWWKHTVSVDSSTTCGIGDWAILNPQAESTLYGIGTDGTENMVLEMFKEDIYLDRESNEDDELAFPSYAISQWHTWREPHLRKIVRQIRTDSVGSHDLFTAKSFSSDETQQQAVQWEDAATGETFGGGGTFGTGATGVFGDSLVPLETRYYTPGTGRAWSLKFYNESSFAWKLYAYTVAIDMRRD